MCPGETDASGRHQGKPADRPSLSPYVVAEISAEQRRQAAIGAGAVTLAGPNGRGPARNRLGQSVDPGLVVRSRGEAAGGGREDKGVVE